MRSNNISMFVSMINDCKFYLPLFEENSLLVDEEEEDEGFKFRLSFVVVGAIFVSSSFEFSLL